jgi:beta-galactosidase/beta-glucuronidase
MPSTIVIMKPNTCGFARQIGSIHGHWIVDFYTEAGDRNITSYIMEWHQRSQIGNDAIIQYIISWFRLPTSFDMLLWLSQILHGIGMKYAVEHWRRSMPRGMGTLYWQINDCWPVASWASIDYYRNWKALHYMARDFFAPLLVSGGEDPQTGTVELHVTSDQLQEGTILAHEQFACNIPPCASQMADAVCYYGWNCPSIIR